MTTRSQTIRQRQLAYRLLNNLESLTFVPAAKWPKSIRNILLVAALLDYWMLWSRMDTLICLAAALVVEVMLFRVQVVEVLREKGE